MKSGMCIDLIEFTKESEKELEEKELTYLYSESLKLRSASASSAGLLQIRAFTSLVYPRRAVASPRVALV